MMVCNFERHELKKFAREYEFNHVTASPKYPQSNGFVENGVKIVKTFEKGL